MPLTRIDNPARASLGERFFLPGLLIAGIGLGIAMGYWFLGTPSIPSNTLRPTSVYAAITAAPAPVVGAPAPDFSLKDIHGRAVQLSGLRGSPVVIAFWATWCEPCRTELPALNEEATRLKILAVNYGEDSTTAISYAQALHLDSLSILLDPELGARDLYLVNALPTTFLVDEKGIIRFLKIGLLEKSELDTALEALGGNR
jgi:peroxiredoxin